MIVIHEANKTALSYQGVSREYCRGWALRQSSWHPKTGWSNLDSTHPKPIGMTGFRKNGTTTNQNGPGPSLDLEDLGLKRDEDPDFMFVYKAGIIDLISKVKEKKLLNRDLIVLFAYLTHTDWKTGRCRLTPKKGAEMLGYKVQTIQPCIKRLKKEHLIVPIQDSRTGERLSLISPYILKAGSSQSRNYLVKVYHDAIKENEPLSPHPTDSIPAGDDEDCSWADEL